MAFDVAWEEMGVSGCCSCFNTFLGVKGLGE
jgi:hypothetical protein